MDVGGTVKNPLIPGILTGLHWIPGMPIFWQQRKVRREVAPTVRA